MPTRTDFYDIDSVLTEEERAVRDSVRQFVDERVLPIIGNCYVDELADAIAYSALFFREDAVEVVEIGRCGHAAKLTRDWGLGTRGTGCRPTAPRRPASRSGVASHQS